MQPCHGFQVWSVHSILVLSANHGLLVYTLRMPIKPRYIVIYAQTGGALEHKLNDSPAEYELTHLTYSDERKKVMAVLQLKK